MNRFNLRGIMTSASRAVISDGLVRSKKTVIDRKGRSAVASSCAVLGIHGMYLGGSIDGAMQIHNHPLNMHHNLALLRNIIIPSSDTVMNHSSITADRSRGVGHLIRHFTVDWVGGKAEASASIAACQRTRARAATGSAGAAAATTLARTHVGR